MEPYNFLIQHWVNVSKKKKTKKRTGSAFTVLPPHNTVCPGCTMIIFFVIQYVPIRLYVAPAIQNEVKVGLLRLECGAAYCVIYLIQLYF